MSEWQRSLDHLLRGPAAEYVARGRDWQTTEMIRRKLDASDGLLTVLRQFVEAVDANAVEISSAEIDLGDGSQPFPWHEEWLHRARVAVAEAQKPDMGTT